MKTSLFEYITLEPFARFGLTAPFWSIHRNTLIQTGVMFGLLVLLTIWCRWIIRRPHNIAAEALHATTTFFMDLVEESCGIFRADIFYFAVSIFMFTFMCGVTGLLPYVGEATQDLNTTFALGISSFAFSQYQGIRAHGILGHFKEYLQPFFLLLPLNVIGELAKAASMSFRLFGNILGGSIIFDLILHALEQVQEYFVIGTIFIIAASGVLYFFPRFKNIIDTHRFPLYTIVLTCLLIVPSVQLFFGLFEGLVQAFVITILTITYSSMAIGDGPDEIPVEPQP